MQKKTRGPDASGQSIEEKVILVDDGKERERERACGWEKFGR